MRRNILAVDDELHMLRLLEQLISKKTTHRIVTTHNALEVPGLLEKQEFDLIITDLRMPGLTGMDILRQVKESHRPEEVIIITAFGTLESVMEALSLGVYDYITKPFKKERLLRSMEGALKRQAAWQNAALLAEMMQKHPYGEAEFRFKQAYLEFLKLSAAGNRDVMIEWSGFSDEEIESISNSMEK